MSIWWLQHCSAVITRATPTTSFPLEPSCRGRWKPARGSPACGRERLLRLEPELLDHRSPAGGFAFDELARLLGRRGREFNRRQPVAEIGDCKDAAQFGIELVDDRT